jgi:hypothetical protein
MMRMAEQSARGTKLMEAFLAESQRGYTPRARALEDSMKVEQVRVATLVYPGIKACGPLPAGRSSPTARTCRRPSPASRRRRG